MAGLPPAIGEDRSTAIMVGGDSGSILLGREPAVGDRSRKKAEVLAEKVTNVVEDIGPLVTHGWELAVERCLNEAENRIWCMAAKPMPAEAQKRVAEWCNVSAPRRMDAGKMAVDRLVVEIECELAKRELWEAAKFAPLGLAHHIHEVEATQGVVTVQIEVCGVILQKVIGGGFHYG